MIVRFKGEEGYLLESASLQSMSFEVQVTKGAIGIKYCWILEEWYWFEGAYVCGIKKKMKRKKLLGLDEEKEQY